MDNVLNSTVFFIFIINRIYDMYEPISMIIFPWKGDTSVVAPFKFEEIISDFQIEEINLR